MSQTLDASALLDIVNAIRFVTEYADTITEEFYSIDRAAQNVIIREMTVIGEASRRLSPEFKQSHPEIPYHLIIGMRNALIHDYDDIVLPSLWDTVKISLPALLEIVERIISQG